jgi:general stress protein 26
MNRKALKNEALDFIKSNRVGAFATVDKKNVPHVAVVYCYVDDDLSIYFMTRVEARKHKNLIAHPIVSMSFSDSSSMKTVQLTGKAKVIDDLKESQDVMYKLFTMRFKDQNSTNPPLQLFERGLSTELAVIKVVPAEMVFANFKQLVSGRYKPFFNEVI